MEFNTHVYLVNLPKGGLYDSSRTKLVVLSGSLSLFVLVFLFPSSHSASKIHKKTIPVFKDMLHFTKNFII